MKKFKKDNVKLFFAIAVLLIVIEWEAYRNVTDLGMGILKAHLYSFGLVFFIGVIFIVFKLVGSWFLDKISE